MRKIVASVMLVAVAAPMLGGCSSWFGGGHAARSQPATKSAPMSPQEAALMAGKDALRQGQYAAAITDFRIARLDPALEAEAYNGLAIAYSNLGRPDLSDRYFRQAIALVPDDRRFAANLARFQQITGSQPVQPAPVEALAQAGAPPATPPAPVLAGAVVATTPSLTGPVAVTARAPDPSGPVRVVVSGPAVTPAAVAVKVSAPVPAAPAEAAPVQVAARVEGAAKAVAPARAAVPVKIAVAPSAVVTPRATAPAARAAAAPAVVAMVRPAASGQVTISAPTAVLSRVAANEVVIGPVRPRPALAARATRRATAPAAAAPTRRLALVETQALYRSQRPGRSIGY